MNGGTMADNKERTSESRTYESIFLRRTFEYARCCPKYPSHMPHHILRYVNNMLRIRVLCSAGAHKFRNVLIIKNNKTSIVSIHCFFFFIFCCAFFAHCRLLDCMLCQCIRACYSVRYGGQCERVRDANTCNGWCEDWIALLDCVWYALASITSHNDVVYERFFCFASSFLFHP